ncbi:hypothetical protein C8R41DRAFT_984589 [Lentinula lateritia]|uniref:Uncharacterized protein n=1 Tax=Lentinula lateritia TaxID=40482 RepID=A0ABQ8V1A1_9AGAR|nr:hypothetical protein C8R41DRAFT_984589 [Lentinula lateritia]
MLSIQEFYTVNGIKDRPWWRTSDKTYSWTTSSSKSTSMCSSQVRIAPLFTTSSTFVQPITGKGPPFRHLLSTNEAPRLFMLIEHDALPSFSSDPLSLLSECSHLTSFDSIPSIPPPTVSLALEASNQQALQAESRDVQLDAVTRYICNVGFGGAGKGDRRGHYPTPHGPVARTKESPGTLKAASNMAWKFQLDDRDCEDVFIRSNSTDKNIRNENYTKGQEGQHPQSLSPSSGDTVLSCWEPGPQFSYHGCDLEVFGPTPYHRGSSTIPDRENDPVVHQHVGRCYTRRIQNSCYAPRLSAMCSSQARTAPLFTTNSIFVPPITGKGPPFRHLLSTNETPRLFMLIDKGSAPSFSSDPLSLLSECSHLTSFDSIPSTPPPTVSLALEASNQQALQAKSRDVQLDAVTRYFCNVGFPNFQLDDPDESSEDVFVRCVTTDKNTKNKNYTQGQEDHHPQSPTPSSGDAILSCWESGSQFSYHGCDLEEFGPIPCQRCQRGSLTIPNREHDPVCDSMISGKVTRLNGYEIAVTHRACAIKS